MYLKILKFLVAVTCDNPTPEHGTLNVVCQTFVFNDTVEISCNEGYTLTRGASRITCSDQANWRPKHG